MHKLALVLFSVLVLTQISQQDPSVQPTCGIDDYAPPCCLQVVQILASATACAKTLTESYAAAYASVHAATKTCVSSLTAAAAANQIAIQQQVALAARPGRCCEVNVGIASNVTSYGGAITKAVAEAKAAAKASADAASIAAASAAAAAQVYASAQTLLASKDSPANPSCCQFAESLSSAVQVIGKFVAEANVVVELANSLSTKVGSLATSCSEAETVVSASAGSALSTSINTCCDEGHWSKHAKDTAHAFDYVTDYTNTVNIGIAEAFDVIIGYAADFAKFEVPVTLEDNICNEDCGKVPVSCNRPDKTCCNQGVETACYTTKNVVKALLDVAAAARTLGEVAVESKSISVAITEACTSASAATAVATSGRIYTSVKRSGCCQVRITVDASLESYAKVVSKAVASTTTVADAYASSSAYASACADAIAKAAASAEAFASAFRGDSDCCSKSCFSGIPNYVNGNCCACSSAIAKVCSSSSSTSIASAFGAALSLSKTIGGSASVLKANSESSVVEVAGLQYSISLNSRCCCCAKTTRAPVRRPY